MKDKNYYNVAVEAPMGLLTYSSSEEFLRGESVLVPLGARKVKGVVLNFTEKPENPKFSIKDILSRDSERSRLNQEHLSWCEWLSGYYFYPLGQVLSLSFPPLSKKKEKKETPKSKKKKLENISQDIEVPETPLDLTEEQEICLKNIKSLDKFSCHLIHGVTGSGKTEIYLQLLEKIKASGKKALILVPEISLTPQMLSRFSKRFPSQVAVVHSSLTPRKKTNEWWDVQEGRKWILVGARSSLFCPLDNLGLVVVDEEHDGSFKQEEKLKYNGRDSAIMLAKTHKCPIILGSATPSLESWKNAIEEKYKLHTLKHRVGHRPQAPIEIINLKDEQERISHNKKDLPPWLSEKLFGFLEKNFHDGNQSALFLNRRGMASMSLCSDCGFILKCPNCDISLTVHGKKYLNCHYCNYSDVLKDVCPECGDCNMKLLGDGTEKVEEDLKKLFPKARFRRVDRDEVRSHKDMEAFIQDMEDHKIDFLIGTQMIAKGLDFKKLTLMGFVLADVEMNWPDFRVNERAFQTFTQVAGRTGRHGSGQVVVQTYNPHHTSLSYFKENDIQGFMSYELENRKQRNYPPFGNLILFRVQGINLIKVTQTAKNLEKRALVLKDQFKEYSGFELLGPAPSRLFRLQNKYRYHLLLKTQDTSYLKSFVEQILEDKSWILSGVKLSLDRDPYQIV